MKIRKALLAIPLVMGLAVFAAPAAHADNVNTDGVITTDNGTSVQVGITKLLQLPVGTIIPTDTFTFLASGNELETDLTTVLGDAPALNTDNMSIGYASTDQASASGDVVTVTMNTGDILAGVAWPHAGIYQYTVTEDQTAPVSTDPAVSPYEHWSDSHASYTLTVYVANVVNSDGSPVLDDNGDPVVGSTGNPAVYVSTVTDTVASEDSLNPNPAAEGTKVDPTPGGDTGASGMAFTNNYVKTDNPNGSDPTTNPSLTISKTVTGALGDKTKYFDFTVTMKPSTLDVNPPAFYMAYVVDSNGIVEDVSANGLAPTQTDANSDTYVEVPADGTSFSFSLKDGQSLNFVGVADGTTYDVNEVSLDGYEPSYLVTTGTTPVQSSDLTLGDASGSATVGTPLDTSTQLVADTTTGGANLAAYTNNRSMITPTGLIMSQLPFVGLFGVVLLALVAFIVVRARAGKKAQAAA